MGWSGSRSRSRSRSGISSKTAAKFTVRTEEGGAAEVESKDKT